MAHRRNCIRDDGNRRDRAHSVLAPPTAADRRVQMGSRPRGRRLLLRLPYLGYLESVRRPGDGHSRTSDRHTNRCRAHVSRLAAGAVRDEPLAPLCHPWRRRRRRRQYDDLHCALTVPAALVCASARACHKHRIRRRRCRGCSPTPLAADDHSRQRLARILCSHGMARPLRNCSAHSAVEERSSRRQAKPGWR